MKGKTTPTAGAVAIGNGAGLRRIGVVGRPAHDPVPGCVERVARFAAENPVDGSF